jgi:tetratricopeptide (TPR) repeat protein
MQLGFVEEALAAFDVPVEVARDYRGIAPAAEVIRKEFPKPRDIWSEGDDAAALFGRLLAKNGRLAEYISYYDAAFKSTGDLFTLWEQRPILFLATAPTLAANLRAVGRNRESEEILSRAEQMVERNLKNGPPTGSEFENLAFIRGAQGRGDEAISYLQKAFAAGWLPDRRFEAIDIADEPAFSSLVNRSDFQAIRKRILARIEEERRKVPRQLLAQAYPVGRESKRAA